MNPRWRAIVEMVDRFSGPVARMTGQQNAFNAAVANGNRLQAMANSQIGRVNQGWNGYIQNVRNATSAQQQNARGMRELRITWLEMLRVMALFAVNLQIIRALMSPFTFLRSGIDQARNFQDQLRGINVLMRGNDAEFKQMSKDFLRLSSTYGIAVGEITAAGREVASTVDALNLGGLDKFAGMMEILKASAKGSLMDQATIEEVGSALLRTLSAMDIPVNRSEEVLKKLFATVDVGNLQFADLTQEMGTFIGTLSAISPTNVNDRLKFLDETLVMYAQITRSLPPSEAATALNQFFQSFLGESAEARAVRAELQQITGTDFSLKALSQNGPMAMVQAMVGGLGRSSPLIHDIITGISDVSQVGQREYEALTSSMSAKTVQTLFPNVRALRGWLALAVGEGEQLGQLQKSYQESLLEFDNAYAQTQLSFNQNLKELRESVNQLKIQLLDPAVKEGAEFLQQMAGSMQAVINAPGFSELSASEKIGSVLDAMTMTFDRWWNDGGEEDVRNFTETFVDGLVMFIERAVFDNSDKFFGIGMEIAQGITKGALKYLADPRNYLLGDSLLNNPIIPTLIAKRVTGLGWGASLGIGTLAQGGTNSLLGGDLFGTLSSLLLIGGLLKRGGRNVVNKDGSVTQAGGNNLTGQIANVALTGAGLRGLLGGVRNLPADVRAAGGLGAVRAGLLGRLGGFLRGGWGRLGIAGAATWGLDQVYSNLTGESAFTQLGRALPSWLGGGQGSEEAVISGLTNANAGIQNAQSTADLFGALGAVADKRKEIDDFGSNIGDIIAGSPIPFFGFRAPEHSAGAFGLSSGSTRRESITALEAEQAGLTGSLWDIGVKAATLGLKDVTGALYDPSAMGPEAFGVIVNTGLNAGLRGNDLARWVAWNMATIARESQFRPTAFVGNDNGYGWSSGLYQLNQQGQGAGYNPQALKNPKLNAEIGVKQMLAAFMENPNADFATLSRLAGHPGNPSPGSRDYESAMQFSGTIGQSAESILKYLMGATEFSAIDTGGLTTGTGGVNVRAEQIVVEDNGNGLRDEFLNAVGEGIDQSRATRDTTGTSVDQDRR